MEYHALNNKFSHETDATLWHFMALLALSSHTNQKLFHGAKRVMELGLMGRLSQGGVRYSAPYDAENRFDGQA